MDLVPILITLKLDYVLFSFFLKCSLHCYLKKKKHVHININIMQQIMY